MMAGVKTKQRHLRVKGRGKLRSVPLGIRVLVFMLIVTVVVAALAPLLAGYSMTQQNLGNRLQVPSILGGPRGHLLGTDHLGRDILARMLYGLRNTLMIALLSTLVGSALGMLLGLVSGLSPSIVDNGVMFVVDARMAIPFIVLALLFAAVFKPGLIMLVLVIGLLGWGPYARLVRGQVLAIKERTFVEASYAIGASRLRIAVEHIVPNLISPFIVLMTLNFGSVVIVESSLSYLGLGVQPPDVSLGSLVSSGRDYLLTAWWISVFPSLVIVSIVLEISLIGDWLRDVFDPRSRKWENG